jgi:hypothetical protein
MPVLKHSFDNHDDLAGIDPNEVAKRAGGMLAKAWDERDELLAEVEQLREENARLRSRLDCYLNWGEHG